MIEPKLVTIEADGKIKDFILHKFDCVTGREIAAKYPMSSIPKLGDYSVNEETMFKLMRYVSVVIDTDKALPLSTAELVKNHVPNTEMLLKIELMMLDYNFSFFRNGRTLLFLKGIAQKVPVWVTKILTTLSASLSQTTKPPSNN